MKRQKRKGGVETEKRRRRKREKRRWREVGREESRGGEKEE